LNRLRGLAAGNGIQGCLAYFIILIAGALLGELFADGRHSRSCN